MAQDQTPPPQASDAPGLQIVTQYIKDLSFENPNAPESLVAGWPAPETTVQVFLGHRLVRENAYECLVHFRVEAKKKGKDGQEDRLCFIADLHYGALAVLQNIPPESHAAAMMIEVPRLMFPFAREIIAGLTAGGGYPPLYLIPVNFETIYVQEMQRLEAEQKAKENKAQ